jgi:putative membrane protein
MTIAAQAEFWEWVPHPEVWVLVLGLVGLYVWAARTIGPKVVPAGSPPVTPAQWRWFGLGVALLWISADWPVHDIGERYLYLVHMQQHLVLTLVVPPVMLLATPEWLARLVVGEGGVDRWVHRLARPVPACFMFSALTLVTHAQFVVNTASEDGLFHYGVHTAIVVSALLFWIPVCGPFPELRISAPAQMLYLFVASIVPTVPGAWLTFAEGAVYHTYDIPDRLWGISVTTDQQIAGLEMKLLAGSYLWMLIGLIFFKWATAQEAVREGPVAPTEVLTYDAVERAFEEHPAPDRLP